MSIQRILIISLLIVASCNRGTCNKIFLKDNYKNPFDSTEYYLKLFADDSEFDIRKFKPLPSLDNWTYGRWSLIDAINPSIPYAYWECRHSRYNGMMPDKEQLVVYNGDSITYSDVAKQYKADFGFFVECHPGICFSNIIAVRHDKTVDIIDDDKKLIQFMGTVDNIEEVILQIKANGYWYGDDTLIGGAYKEEEDRYLLYLREWIGCPFTFKSVKAILYKTGKFEEVSKVTYLLTDRCIIE